MDASKSSKPTDDGYTTPQKKSPKRTKWRCDICLSATFDTYNEAVEHENGCTGKDNVDNVVKKVVAKKTKKAKRGESPKKEESAAKESVAEAQPSDVGVANEIVDLIAKRETKQPDTKLPTSVAKLSSPKKAVKPKTVATQPKKSPIKPQSKPKENQLVDSLAMKTSEMPVQASGKVESKSVTAKANAAQGVDTKIDEAAAPSMEKIKDEPVVVSTKQSNSAIYAIIKTVLVLAPIAMAATAYLPFDDIHDKLSSITLPSYAVLAASPLILILASYTTFGLALAITHQGVHHHTSRGFILDIFIALRDTIAPPSIDYVNWDNDTPTPTLREYLKHPDGFSMAFCPAFFGFYAYFGALVALEDETKLIVPKLNGDTVECGLKSVSGASAGAMAAVMLAAGIQPRDAAEYVCKFHWGMVADPPGLGGLVRGNKFEEFMRTFIKDGAVRAEGKDGDVMLEDALVPVAVSGFDLLRMKGTIMSSGCMAKAARSSAGFPGLFQPVSWNDGGRKLLVDGGIRDGLGLNGLSALASKSPRGMRVINFAVGDFGMRGSNGLEDLPVDVKDKTDSLVSIAIVNTPTCGPWAMANGPRAVESAKKAMAAMLDTPFERGTSKDHYLLRVDASKWLE